MIDFVKSLTLASGSFVVTLFTLVCLMIWCIFLKRRPTWSMAIVLPWLFAYVLYWFPIWMGANLNLTEHQAWQMLVIGVWGLIGMVVACICLLVIKNIMSQDL